MVAYSSSGVHSVSVFGSLVLTDGVLVATGNSLHLSVHHGVHLPWSELLGVLQLVAEVGTCLPPSVQVTTLCGGEHRKYSREGMGSRINTVPLYKANNMCHAYNIHHAVYTIYTAYSAQGI